MRSRYYRDVLTFAISLLIINNVLSQTATVTNSAPITITTGTVASTYPSTINVSGLTGVITGVTITLNNFSHSRPDDVDVLLVGPAGQAFVFWSDAGGTGATDNVTNQTFTFSDAAASLLSDENALISGTYKPTNYEATADVFAAPAPAGPYHGATPSGTSTLAVFNATNPNGVWSLYIVDDAISGSNGSIAGGWTLNINTSAGVVTPSVTINQASGQTDPATTGPINFTAVFNEPVTGFESSDVSISGTAGATTAVVTEITPNNGTRYNVAVTGMTSTGTVIASLPAGIAINSGSVGNTASTSIDNVVTFSQPPSQIPVTVTINQAVSQSDPTNTGPVNFTAVFSEPVTGFISTDVLLSGTAAATSVSITEIAPNNGTTYNVAVSGMSISGTIIATLPSNIALSLTNVGNNASTSTDNTVNYIEPPALPVITNTYTNSSGITMSTAAGVANPYPSTINVSGLTGTVTNVTLVITGFSHTRPDNVDMLLVGPAGQTLLFWSDAGGIAPGDNVTNQTFTFSDAAATFLSDESLLVSGTYRPTNYGATADVFQAPAPSGPYNESGPLGTFRFNVFRGSDPNGVWSLYIINDGTQISAPTISGWTLNLTTTAPLPAVGSLIISEFRLRGPGGTNDEFIEIYNPTASDHTVRSISGGYGIATSDGTTRATIPNDVVIKAKQHYLLTGSTYSLANYGGTGAAAGNISYATDIPDNMGIAIFNNNTGGASYTLENRIDAVGSSTEANAIYKEGTGYPPLGTSNLESSVRRKTYTSVPQDSDDNSIDFEFIDNLGTTNGIAQKSGAPGPENSNSPISRNSNIVVSRLDQTKSATAVPNMVVDLTEGIAPASKGKLDLRYKITNNTGAPITRLRLRIDSITGKPAGAGFADLRAITSTNLVAVGPVLDPSTCSPASIPCNVSIQGTTLEEPPVQASGGGFNSSLSVGAITTGTPLANGASVYVRLLFGIEQTGAFSISFTPEVLPATAVTGSVPLPEKLTGIVGSFAVPTVTINQASTQADPTNASPVNFTAVFSKPVTGFTSSDIILSGNAGATTAVVTEIAPNDGTTFNVAVSGMTTSGTIIASIPAGAAQDNLSQLSQASTSTDNTVTFSSTSSTGINVTINQASTQTDPTDISPINFTVVFSEAVTGFTSSDVLLSGATAGASVVVSEIAPNNGTTYNVAVSGMIINGTVSATIPAGAAQNQSMNTNTASTSSDNSITFEGACLVRCPANITVEATSPSGALVDYGDVSPAYCGNLSVPVSGFVFPIGTTTVNAYSNVPNQETMYLLGSGKFYKYNPGTGSISGPVTITGLRTGDFVVSIDFRPSTGQLYALTTNNCNPNAPIQQCGRLYIIDKTSGAATQVGTSEYGLITGDHEIEFDPVTDVIHMIGGEYPSHFTIDPATGIETYIGFRSNLPGFRGIAFSNNHAGATFSTLYGLTTEAKLYTIGGVNGVPPPNINAAFMVGDLNQDPNDPFVGISPDRTGFDITTRGITWIVSDNELSGIDLKTGWASLLGIINVTEEIRDISVEPYMLSNPGCSFTVTVTPQPITVTINQAATQADPAINIPVRFTVEFSEEVTGFDAADISFAGSTVPGTLVATVTGTGPTYTVTVTGMTGAGNVIASIPAGAAANTNGVTSLASTSTDNVIQLLVFENDFVITKTATSPFVAAGGIITYVVNVVRLPVTGSNPPYSGVEVVDLLPAGTTFIGFEPIQVNTAIPVIIVPSINTNGTVRVIFPVFFPTQNFSFYLRVRVGTEMTGIINNTATVNGPLGDVNPINNSATAAVQIAVPPTITCPGNITVYTSSETCTSQYTVFPAHFTVTGTPAPVISIDATNGNHVWGTDNLTSTGRTTQLQVGVYTVEATATNAGGSASCSYTITVIDNTPPKILVCPTDITVNVDAGKCSAFVEYEFQVEDSCTETLYRSINGVAGSSSGGGPLYIQTRGTTYPVGVTTLNVVYSDDYGNSSSCTFKITVIDNEKPVITQKPGDVTVECTSQIPAVDISSVSATDNCGTTTITHVNDVISNQTCANKYTVTRTYRATDGSGNTATASQMITVDDKTPPTITGLTPSKRILAPPNHKMVDVTLAYTVNDNCVSTPNVTVSITSNEPVNGTGDGDTDPDWEVIDARHIRLRAERSGQGTGRIYTITVTVNDGCNAPVSATTEVYVVHNITGPHSGNSFKVGSTVAFTGEFWDVPGNKHTAKWLIDGISVNGVVTEPVGSKNGKVTGSYKFTTPGVYKLQMNITDQKGVTTYANTNGDLEAIVVIYDPNGGYTYGGGYYDSPAGALISNSSSAGKASYGFTMNYFKNSTNPKGETQFEFKVGEFEYNALNFDYLVISNSMAQFKGTGKIIGGQSGIAFTMTVVDGQLDGTGIDKIRMKIYNKNNGKIIYDNQPGASDAALPIASVGANSIIVIQGTNANPATTRTYGTPVESESKSKDVDELTATVYPNPASTYFNIIVNSNDAKEKIVLQVLDQYGRVLEVRNNVSVGSTVRLGDLYRSGLYYVRVIQGKQHKELKLIKLN